VIYNKSATTSLFHPDKVDEMAEHERTRNIRFVSEVVLRYQYVSQMSSSASTPTILSITST
jgi:hypothetical protein